MFKNHPFVFAKRRLNIRNIGTLQVINEISAHAYILQMSGIAHGTSRKALTGSFYISLKKQFCEHKQKHCDKNSARD